MKRKKHKRTPVEAFLKPKRAVGGPVRVIDPEAEERRLIQRLREIARGWMLTTLPTVPGVQSGEVVGLDGKVWPMLCGDCCTLWVSSQYMAGVQLDPAGVRALVGLLREIEQAMQPV